MRLALSSGSILGAAILWVAAAGAAPSDSGKASESARAALEEMADLERRIDGLHRRQWEERTRMLDVEGSLEALERRLDEQRALQSEGHAFIEHYRDRVDRETERIDRRIDEELAQLRAARRGLELVGTALAATAEDAPARERLALALMHRVHHDRALLASRRALRLEGERARLAMGGEQAGRLSREHSAFAGLREIEMRERHEELAGQLDSLRDRIAGDEQELARLAERREQIRGLVGRLVEQEAAGVADPAPAAPAVSAEERLIEAVSGRRPEPAAERPEPRPLVALSPVDEYGDGTRHAFWRAEPVLVRALAPGRVVFSEPFAGYRHLLIIDHGDGWRTLVGNMTRGEVAPGARVEAGQLVGRYQSSLDARAEPLWFEVRRGVAPVTPTQWPGLPDRWDAALFSGAED